MAKPANRLSRLPTWISHWLGYRAAARKPLNPYLIYLWSFIGAFCGLATIQAILYYGPAFTSRHVALVASFGASAVLCYGSIELPLAQPRNLVFGHFISALIGVCILKLFLLLPATRFDSLLWLSSSLATAIAIVAMQVTKTTHPPAGATALIPILDEGFRDLGWYYLPVVLLCSAVVLASALFINNLQRRWPVYWIAPTTAPAAEKAALKLSEPTEEARNGLAPIMQAAGTMTPTTAPDMSTRDASGRVLPTQPEPTHQAQGAVMPMHRLDEFPGWYEGWAKASLSHDDYGSDDDKDGSDKV